MQRVEMNTVFTDTIIIDGLNYPIDAILLARYSPVFAKDKRKCKTYQIGVSPDSVQQFINACHMHPYDIPNLEEMWFISQYFEVDQIRATVEKELSKSELGYIVSLLLNSHAKFCETHSLDVMISKLIPEVIRDQSMMRHIMQLPFAILYRIFDKMDETTMARCSIQNYASFVHQCVSIHGKFAYSLLSYMYVPNITLQDITFLKSLSIEWDYVNSVIFRQFVDRVMNLQAKLQSTDRTISALEKNIADDVRARDEISKKNEIMQGELASTVSKLAASRKDLVSYEQMKKTVRDMDKEIETLKQKQLLLEKEISDVKKEHTNAQKQVVDMTKERNSVQEEVKMKEQEKSSVKQRKDSSRLVNQELAKKCDELRTQLVDQNTAKARLEEQLSAVRKNIEDAKKLEQDLNAKNDALYTQLRERAEHWRHRGRGRWGRPH